MLAIVTVMTIDSRIGAKANRLPHEQPHPREEIHAVPKAHGPARVAMQRRIGIGGGGFVARCGHGGVVRSGPKSD